MIEDAVAQVVREPQSGFTYLNFGGEFPNHTFRTIIPHAVERLTEDSVLQASRLRVRGIPQLGPSGVPEIICADPAQVAVAPGGGPAPTTTIVPPPAVTLRARP